MNTISVLLADDHVVVRKGVKALLAAEPDIEVVGEAANGREAVRLARELRPAVVVMDVSMPQLNGLEAARQIITSAISDGRQWLDPVEIKRLLEAYEIAMVPTFAAVDAEEAVAHASKLFAQGATVVLKIMSRDIVHKSDVGGVVLNLTSSDAVRAATADILARAKALRPEARIFGVIV